MKEEGKVHILKTDAALLFLYGCYKTFVLVCTNELISANALERKTSHSFITNLRVLVSVLVLLLQDIRTLRFAHKQETHSRRGMYDRLQIVAFPGSYGKNVFAFSYKGEFQDNGWKVYEAEKELLRLVRIWAGGGQVKDLIKD